MGCQDDPQYRQHTIEREEDCEHTHTQSLTHQSTHPLAHGPPDPARRRSCTHPDPSSVVTMIWNDTQEKECIHVSSIPGQCLGG